MLKKHYNSHFKTYYLVPDHSETHLPILLINLPLVMISLVLDLPGKASQSMYLNMRERYRVLVQTSEPLIVESNFLHFLPYFIYTARENRDFFRKNDKIINLT